jgi:hypothetical protein
MSLLGNPRRNARKRIPPATRRRALELLAASPGATDAILVAHGLTIDLLVELVRAGLATAKAERVIAWWTRGRGRETEDHRGGAENSETTAKSDLGNCRLGRFFTPVLLLRACARYGVLHTFGSAQVKS